MQEIIRYITSPVYIFGVELLSLRWARMWTAVSGLATLNGDKNWEEESQWIRARITDVPL